MPGANPANTYQTYDFGFAAGSKNREDLLNIMVNIAPWETPFFSSAPKTRCAHTTHEWIEDTLAATDGAGGTYYEGQDFSAKAVQTRTRASNWTQIFRKDIAVSETQQVVNPAGVSNEYSYQIESALKEIARNVETRLFDTSNAAATGASATSRLMKSLNDFLTGATTNNVNVSASPLSLTASSATYGKSVVDRLVRLCFQSGGMPRRVYMTPYGKEQMLASLSNVNNAFNYRNVAASENAIYFNIDVYQSAFGTVELVADRFIPTATAQASTTALSLGRMWAIEQSKARIAFLRPVTHKPLPPNGDSVRGMVRGELTLELQAASSAGVAHGFAWNVFDA